MSNWFVSPGGMQPAAGSFVIVPDDATPQPAMRGIYVNVDGVFVWEGHVGDETTWNVFAGQIVACNPKLIKTGTTADIVGVI